MRPVILIGRIAPIRRRRRWLRPLLLTLAFLTASAAAFAGVLWSFGAFG